MVKRLNYRTALPAVIACLTTSNLLHAQNAASSVTPVQLAINDHETIALQRHDHSDANVDVDGRIDEAVWGRVDAINQMRVIDPDTLEGVPYTTLVRFFYTERGLYVSFDMEQPAESIVQRISTRDNLAINRDTVSMTLDTSGQGLFGYWMTLALGDNQADGTILPERQYSTQ